MNRPGAALPNPLSQARGENSPRAVFWEKSLPCVRGTANVIDFVRQTNYNKKQ